MLWISCSVYTIKKKNTQTHLHKPSPMGPLPKHCCTNSDKALHVSQCAILRKTYTALRPSFTWQRSPFHWLILPEPLRSPLSPHKDKARVSGIQFSARPKVKPLDSYCTRVKFKHKPCHSGGLRLVGEDGMRGPGQRKPAQILARAQTAVKHGMNKLLTDNTTTKGGERLWALCFSIVYYLWGRSAQENFQ